ncbi:MAG TPA: hypothetical protein VMY06_10120 [Sedimentisphaerales bacterium]|nr:hypothetical protein [Sedimentisphaerales bacterium]
MGGKVAGECRAALRQLLAFAGRLVELDWPQRAQGNQKMIEDAGFRRDTQSGSRAGPRQRRARAGKEKGILVMGRRGLWCLAAG